jgi:hypothetical protein
MLEPPSAFEMFLVTLNYAGGLANIKNKTPGVVWRLWRSFQSHGEFVEETSESKPHENNIFSGVPLVLTFVKRLLGHDTNVRTGTPAGRLSLSESLCGCEGKDIGSS